MSGEIVVGACYRGRGSDAVRVIGVNDVHRMVTFASLDGENINRCSVDLFANTFSVRVPDPTPAVVDDAERDAARGRFLDAIGDSAPLSEAEIGKIEREWAEPPLAGEMTLRQVEAWRVRRGIDDLSLMYATRTGLWHAHAERDGTVIGHGTSSDPQDAITALMAWVGP